MGLSVLRMISTLYQSLVAHSRIFPIIENGVVKRTGAEGKVAEVMGNLVSPTDSNDSALPVEFFAYGLHYT